ncbi:hypothetical protein WJX72_005466 [[Myrmecia] bisecta]|uniref:GAGA-binding transcriptional activator n=1 Tax=[Myrmecia] bisecta TaxID=41462 RepID=A0AAW1Q0U9_9CHLO
MIPKQRSRSHPVDEAQLAEVAAVADLPTKPNTPAAGPAPCLNGGQRARDAKLQQQLWAEQAAAATAIAQQRALELKVAKAEADALALQNKLAAAEEERDRLARECSAMVAAQLRLRQAGLVDSIYTQFDCDLPTSCYAQHARCAPHTSHFALIGQ